MLACKAAGMLWKQPVGGTAHTSLVYTTYCRAASRPAACEGAADVELSMLQDVCRAGCMQPSGGEHPSDKHSQGPQAAAGLAARSCKSASPIMWVTGQQLVCRNPWHVVSLLDLYVRLTAKAAAVMLEPLAVRAVLAQSGHSGFCWLLGLATRPCCRLMLAAATTSWERCLRRVSRSYMENPAPWLGQASVKDVSVGWS